MKNTLNKKMGQLLFAAVCGVVTFTSGPAQAQDMGAIVGVRTDSADAKSAGLTTSGNTGMQAGGIAKFEISAPWQVRTGFIYSLQSYDVKAASSTATAKFSYFEIPVGLLYKFSEYGGAFVGPNLKMNVTKDCGSLTCSGVNSMPLGLQLGGSFKVAPQIGFEFYYETLFSKIADEIENPKAVVANLMITFD